MTIIEERARTLHRVRREAARLRQEISPKFRTYRRYDANDADLVLKTLENQR